MVSHCSVRLAPLGTDRHHSRYWYLPGHAGLYVEKGWCSDYYHYQTELDESVTDLADEKVEPYLEK